MAVTVKDCHAMTSYYEKAYKKRYGIKPTLNRYAARWGFDSVLQGIPPDEVRGLIDFYFTTDNSKRHPLEWFFYNYEKLIDSKRESDRDAERQARLRRESAQRAKEWRERGNKGIADNQQRPKE